MGAKNCPETPRQKMIAMMYLVLTALLALNVSREIVEAFRIIEKGVSETTKNFGEKNNSIYASFAQAEIENPVKVREWREKADQVKIEADKLYDSIQTLKIELIVAADGPDNKAVKGRKIYPDSITRDDDLNISNIIMMGNAESNQRAKNLKQQIINYKEKLLQIIPNTESTIIQSVQRNLYTEDPKRKGTELVTWESLHFQDRPLIAVITLLSKMQADVRNAESDIINYLFKQIDASSFKFNKLEAVIKAKSNYIFQGGQYEADVFLAAFDTTQKPEIYVGPIDSVELEDGTWDYVMKGELGVNYDTLTIHNSIGKYSINCNSLSPKITWGGLIFYPTPDGGVNKYKFNADYQVAESQVVVSPTKMNVFYLGVDNPIDVSVPGVPIEDIYPEINNGTISKSKDGTGYIVKPKKLSSKKSKTFVTVYAEIEGQRREMGKSEFRVKKLPDPVAMVAQMKGGKIDHNLLLAQNGVWAELEGSDFEAVFKVTEFTVTAKSGSYEDIAVSSSNKFTEKQKTILRSLKRNQRVFFEQIKARGPDGLTRDLPPLVFKIK